MAKKVKVEQDNKKWMTFFANEGFKLASELPDLTSSIIPLPSPTLNWAIGNGGIVEGKWVLLFGPESGGKSLLMQLMLAEILKKYPDGICVLFDTEYSLSKEWFARLGGDPSRLELKQTNKPLEIFDWVNNKLKPKIEEGMPVKAICIDSIRAIQFPKDEGETTGARMGGSGAGYLTRALKALVPAVKPNNITTILTQHVYEELDQWKKMRNPWIVPDGRTLRHYSDYMAQVERIDNKDSFITQNKVIVGHKVRVTMKKNKTAAPFRKAEFQLDYEQGIINTDKEVYDLAKSLGVVGHPIDPTTGQPNVHGGWTIPTLMTPEETLRNEKEMMAFVSQNTEKVLIACGMQGREEDTIPLEGEEKDTP